jgi:hypothetical protein
MTIQVYFNHTKRLTEQYAATDAVLEVKVTFDTRPGEQGYLSGSMSFTDGSILYFREYLDTFEGTLDKLMYTYHYQDAENQLIFRYDNALHKPALSFREHKHLSGKIEKAPAPTLEDIFGEIFTVKGWM